MGHTCSDDFRSHVGGSSVSNEDVLLGHLFTGQESAYTEVTYLDLAQVVKKDILQLDVLMHDTLVVDVAKTYKDLLKDVLCEGLIKFGSSAHVMEQVAPCAKLHVHEFILAHIDVLVHLNDVWVPQVLQQGDLIVKLLVAVVNSADRFVN